MVVTSQAAVFADTGVEAAEEKSNTEAEQMVSEKIDDAVRVIQEEQTQLPIFLASTRQSKMEKRKW